MDLQSPPPLHCAPLSFCLSLLSIIIFLSLCLPQFLTLQSNIFHGGMFWGIRDQAAISFFSSFFREREWGFQALIREKRCVLFCTIDALFALLYEILDLPQFLPRTHILSFPPTPSMNNPPPPGPNSILYFPLSSPPPLPSSFPTHTSIISLLTFPCLYPSPTPSLFPPSLPPLSVSRGHDRRDSIRLTLNCNRRHAGNDMAEIWVRTARRSRDGIRNPGQINVYVYIKYKNKIMILIFLYRMTTQSYITCVRSFLFPYRFHKIRQLRLCGFFEIYFGAC